LKAIRDGKIFELAKELQGSQDYWIYRYAFSPGLQEYTEARCFLDFVTAQPLSPLTHINSEFNYPIAPGFAIDLQSFLLGILDLPGEVTRFAINAVGRGMPKVAIQSSNFLQQMLALFREVPLYRNREVESKLRVLEQSADKLQRACYSIAIRGQEYPAELMAESLFARDEGQ